VNYRIRKYYHLHAGLSEVHLTYSGQRRRDKYLLTKFVREGTYIDVIEREVPRGLDITDLKYYTLPPVRIAYPPCANSHYPPVRIAITPLCE
jgi:hypothetical protein